MNLVLQDAVKREPFLWELWTKLCLVLQRTGTRKKLRQLRLCESLPLGEKRFVAVVQFETERFLIGGSPESINLLARLGETADFPEVLSDWCERQR